MFISNSNAQLKENGNLLIFVAHGNNQKLKSALKCFEISPFSKGFGVKLKKHDKIRTINVNHTDSINLINKAHDSHPKLIIHHFLADIPENIKALVGQYLYAQTSMLQFCAQSLLAKDFLVHHPNLFWLVCITASRDNISISKMNHILQLKQKNMLQFCFPSMKITQQHINLLAKIVIFQGNKDEAECLLNIVTAYDRKVIQLMSHWHFIPVALFNEISDFPYLAQCKLINRFCCYPNKLEGKALSNKVDELIMMIKDTLEIGLTIGINHSIVIIKKINSIDKMKKLHDRWMESAAFQNSINHVEEPDELLAKPPIDGDENIIALKTPRELFEEGRSLHHCVYTYREKVRNLESYIYKMVEPERCTVELKLGPNSSISLGSVFSYCNEPVSSLTIMKIENWLENSLNTSHA